MGHCLCGLQILGSPEPQGPELRTDSGWGDSGEKSSSSSGPHPRGSAVRPEQNETRDCSVLTLGSRALCLRFVQFAPRMRKSLLCHQGRELSASHHLGMEAGCSLSWWQRLGNLAFLCAS